MARTLEFLLEIALLNPIKALTLSADRQQKNYLGMDIVRYKHSSRFHYS